LAALLRSAMTMSTMAALIPGSPAMIGYCILKVFIARTKKLSLPDFLPPLLRITSLTRLNKRQLNMPDNKRGVRDRSGDKRRVIDLSKTRMAKELTGKVMPVEYNQSPEDRHDMEALAIHNDYKLLTGPGWMGEDKDGKK